MLLYRRRIDHVYDRRTARRRDVRLARTRVSLFRTYAAADLKNNYAKYASYTIKAYLDEKGYSQEFQRKNILARVNAMYFCFDTGPETTPFVSVMSYYTLQEAFGTPFGAERLYFVQGAQFWLRALAKNCGATVYSGTGELSVTPTSNGAVQVSPATGPGGGVYDACVFACHADDALRTGKAVLTAAQSSLLGKFTYTLSTGVAHADVRLLPPNRNAWRTYNVRIRDTGEAQSQYAMTYVENRHQNDSVAIYDHYDLPEFYVSLNPYRAPDPKLVLADIDGTPVQSTFYHNLVDQAALAAQHELWAVQGNNNL